MEVLWDGGIRSENARKKKPTRARSASMGLVKRLRVVKRRALHVWGEWVVESPPFDGDEIGIGNVGAREMFGGSVSGKRSVFTRK